MRKVLLHPGMGESQAHLQRFIGVTFIGRANPMPLNQRYVQNLQRYVHYEEMKQKNGMWKHRFPQKVVTQRDVQPVFPKRGLSGMIPAHSPTFPSDLIRLFMSGIKVWRIMGRCIDKG
jgi:hypothetical protein